MLLLHFKTQKEIYVCFTMYVECWISFVEKERGEKFNTVTVSPPKKSVFTIAWKNEIG